MATNPLHDIQIPGARTAVLQQENVFTPAWYKFFSDFFSKAALAIDLAQLMVQVDALQSLVSQLLAKNQEMEQSLIAASASISDLEDLKRRLDNLETFESVRMNHGYLDS